MKQKCSPFSHRAVALLAAARRRRQARGITTRRSPARAARSSRRSSPPGRRRSARRSATRCSTARRLRRRHRGDHEPQVDFGASDAPLTPDQQTACKGCVQIPWALSATAVAYNVPGAPSHLQPDGQDDREDLPRPDHELERPGDQGAEQGRRHAEPEDHAGLPLGRIRHDLQLHRLPLGRQRRLEDEGRQLDAVSFPAGIGARGSSGVAGVVSPDDGGITYVDVAYALKNHIKFAAVRNAAGKFLFPSLRRIAAAAEAFPKVPANNELHIVNPPKSAPLAYPISTYTYVIVPQQTSHASRAAQDDLLGADAGPDSRSTPRSSSSRRCRSRCSSRPRRR